MAGAAGELTGTDGTGWTTAKAAPASTTTMTSSREKFDFMVSRMFNPRDGILRTGFPGAADKIRKKPQRRRNRSEGSVVAFLDQASSSRLISGGQLKRTP